MVVVTVSTTAAVRSTSTSTSTSTAHVLLRRHVTFGDLARMPMPFGKVSLCNGKFAIDTVPKFDPGVAAGKIRTEKFGAVFDVLGNNEIGSL